MQESDSIQLLTYTIEMRSMTTLTMTRKKEQHSALKRSCDKAVAKLEMLKGTSVEGIGEFGQ